MLFLIRFSYVALLLIFVPLFFPGFEPGARLVVLVEAALIALIIRLIRMIIGERLNRRSRGLVAGAGLLLGLIVAKRVFDGVVLSPEGMLLAYLGLVFLEILLPTRIRKEVSREPHQF
jgi:hypothetical protein